MGLFDAFRRKKLEDGLEKTRTGFFQSIVNTLTNAEIDDDLYNDLEEQLILADVGPATAVRLVDELRDKVQADHLKTGEQALKALREIIRLEISPHDEMDLTGHPAVILVIGVNGVGKNHDHRQAGLPVQGPGQAGHAGRGRYLPRRRQRTAGNLGPSAPGCRWSRRAKAPTPAAVIFDAVQSAAARNYDIVIADTAGRLHNKKGLMDELSKIARSVKKASPEASLEVLLVLDAITGQNAISQAQEFCRAAGATGVVLTKLDGTPKGGCILAVHEKLGLPIRFVGVGEKLDDLLFFSATDFSEALLPELPKKEEEA